MSSNPNPKFLTTASQPSNVNIPYLPNEVIIEVLKSLQIDDKTGNCLDDPYTQKFIFSLREVSPIWNSLVLDVFLRDTHLTTGYFPPKFTPLNPITALRARSYNDEEKEDEEAETEEEIFIRMEEDIQLLHRSDYFINFHGLNIYGIRTLTVDISCTTGDIEPRNVRTFNREFAMAAMSCGSLEKITIRAHGMCRLDNPGNGLDAWFTAWNWSVDEEEEEGGVVEKKGCRIREGNADEWFLYGGGFMGTRMVPHPPGAIFPKLKELTILGYTDATTFSDIGMSDLLHFIIRHRRTLETIRLENIGLKDSRRNHSCPAHVANGDAVEACKFWNKFRRTAWRNCEGLKELVLKMLSYTIVRHTQPPLSIVPQGVLSIDHAIVHNVDWPYESEVRISYIEEFNSLTMYHVKYACACQRPVFMDPEDGKGMDLINESHRFVRVEVDLQDEAEGDLD
ncbi:uncharacterized protein DFL_004524 [Arthrobotrys flagrans]|uniref:F-box domain-containing protein n=1 Tax=Arthrobotrys flagrans TaxID=97331 RepID=A0A437A5A8_ARTFL|nr:hypothetical protein DFL_004524 [Arthrobotrys flagrans]